MADDDCETPPVRFLSTNRIPLPISPLMERLERDELTAHEARLARLRAAGYVDEVASRTVHYPTASYSLQNCMRLRGIGPA